MIEIIIPGGIREWYQPKGNERAGLTARNFARIYKLKGKHWRFRGARGPINPRLMLRNLDLPVGECLKLERTP